MAPADFVHHGMPNSSSHCPPLFLLSSLLNQGSRMKIAMDAHSERWWTQGTVAVVTGANKGIGLETVKQIAEKGITVVLTARDVKRGEEATKKLVEQGLPVVYHQLDVASAESAERLASWLKQQYGFLDILINNAGHISPDPNGAVASFDVNYYGVKNVTNAILPLIRASEAGARILNVSSNQGQLKNLKKEFATEILGNVEQLSEESIDKVIQEYLADVKKQKASDWSLEFEPTYRISKACLNAYTRLVAKNLAGRPPGQKIFANCICPGANLTDMFTEYFTAAKVSIPEGVVIHGADVGGGHVARLALLPANKLQTGVWWVQSKESEF